MFPLLPIHKGKENKMTFASFWDDYDLVHLSKEFRDRWDDVAKYVDNFDGNLIEKSLQHNWTVEYTISVAKQIEEERQEYSKIMDYEMMMDRDMSMNY